jgi:hypothetical protein
MNTSHHHNKSVEAPFGADAPAAAQKLTTMCRGIAGAGLVATSLCLALTTFAPPAMADPAPVIHYGSDTRNMAQPTCMAFAEAAIKRLGLDFSRPDDYHVVGVQEYGGIPGGTVLVTCLSLGDRTFIEVVGTSLDSGTAERLRNTVREFVMVTP